MMPQQFHQVAGEVVVLEDVCSQVLFEKDVVWVLLLLLGRCIRDYRHDFLFFLDEFFEPLYLGLRRLLVLALYLLGFVERLLSFLDGRVAGLYELVVLL